MIVYLTEGSLDLDKLAYCSRVSDDEVFLYLITSKEKFTYYGVDAKRILAAVREFSHDPKDMKMEDVAHIKHNFTSDEEHLNWWKSL